MCTTVKYKTKAHPGFCFLVSLGMFGWGTLTGWTNAANPQLRSNESGSGFGFGTGLQMDDEGSSWVGSAMAFGAILGSIFAG